jgi:dTDP-4-dehydrorhamnose 3,5-epimerase
MGRAVRRSDSPCRGHSLKFHETAIGGVYVIEPEPHHDERGFFARVWCADEMHAHGLDSNIVQSSVSYNKHRGTLRGMHYQAAPHEEMKTVRCTSGAIYDVVIDLRLDSASYRKWLAMELTAQNRKTLYVPKGVAHGFITLADDAEVLYQMGVAFAADAGRGVRWDDPAFGIDWPMQPAMISERDRGYAPWTF